MVASPTLRCHTGLPAKGGIAGIGVVWVAGIRADGGAGEDGSTRTQEAFRATQTASITLRQAK